MKIDRLCIENFRSFGNQTIINDLSDVNVFIGPNNAGKSNILQALRYIQKLNSPPNQPEYSEVVFDGKIEKNIQFTLTFSLSNEERHELIDELLSKNSKIETSDFDNSDFLKNLTYNVVLSNAGLLEEKLSTPNILEGELTLFRVSPINDDSSMKRMNQGSLNLFGECTKLEKYNNIPENLKSVKISHPGKRAFNFNVSAPLNVNKKILLKVNNFPSKWKWLEPIRQSVDEMDAGELRTLDSAGASLVGFLFTLQINDQDERNRLKDEIMKILPSVETIVSPLRGKKVKLKIGEKSLESERDLLEISSGIKQILILVCGIMNIEPNSLVLIEEPELFLHAGSQRKLFDLIKRETENKQFLITSHSPIFTGCTEKISTYLVTKKEGISSVRKLVEPEGMKCIKYVLGHRNTDFFGFECVVFIEGDSEDVAFPIIAEAMGYDLVEKGIYLKNVRGKDNFSKIREYLEYLKDSDVLAYVLADGNKKVKTELDDWIREGLLQEKCKTVWALEFEDCFSFPLIVEALNTLLQDQEIDYEITIDELKKNHIKGQSVVKTLQKIFYSNKLPPLKKPDLSESIALLLKKEIKASQSNKRKQSKPEEVVERLVKLVESRFEEET